VSPGQLWWGEQSLCARRGPGREVLGSGEFVQQSLLRLQIGGAKSFGEPLINRRQQIARLTDAVPVAQQAGEDRRRAESQDNAPAHSSAAGSDPPPFARLENYSAIGIFALEGRSTPA
jgi:hypothetical protein